jgi:hypothetical protein
MFFFGYATFDGQKENPTDFYHFENPSQELKDLDYGFRSANEKAMKEVTSKNRKIKEFKNFEMDRMK